MCYRDTDYILRQSVYHTVTYVTKGVLVFFKPAGIFVLVQPVKCCCLTNSGPRDKLLDFKNAELFLCHQWLLNSSCFSERSFASRWQKRVCFCFDKDETAATSRTISCRLSPRSPAVFTSSTRTTPTLHLRYINNAQRHSVIGQYSTHTNMSHRFSVRWTTWEADGRWCSGGLMD